MKILIKGTAVFMAMLLLNSPMIASAATQSFGPVNVSAIVNSGLTLSVVLKKNSSTGATVTDMAFGTLLDDDNNNTLRSSVNGSTGTGSVVAMILATSSGTPYTISQSSSAAMSSSGGATIPAGASLRTIQAHYSITDDPAAGSTAIVPTNQLAGSYSGTITITVTA